ncbi:TetR/AcrR family transcriptional regulator [Pantoea sp. Mb-10]|uniref:TetR/AcrR family transcriptional regulator n=1 Tax=unclassified Pantoea TaxID=2630326 RepID=UPI001E2C6FE1|nr:MULTISPECIES: TetR/AcrR family transcriptional regulator [unclassified Pantoea]MCE0492099.1 TetR/AcrR family transcriptional regulator [Pantoea sp. Mb-10]MCE0502473.1 TetR/AcrR family transcriptional regulator [Pantoea sp. Pb-8]
MSRSENILDAAERCMRQHGFYQTSVQQIARESGVSIGLIYKYYKNKEAIIEALVTRVVQRMITLLNADFKHAAHAATHSAQDIVPPAVEQSIVLLMEVSAEATRNARIHHIMQEAWQELGNNFIRQEQALNPTLEARVIRSRLSTMSLIIDGLIIRRCMKQQAIPEGFLPFFAEINREVHRPDGA